MTPPLHACNRALCPCPKDPAGLSVHVAARIAATMAVAGLAARPALDLFSDSGGGGGSGTGGSNGGRRRCLCPGAAALTRTTLIVTAAFALLAVVTLSVRLCTAPPQPAQTLVAARRHQPPPLPPLPPPLHRTSSSSSSPAEVDAPVEAASRRAEPSVPSVRGTPRAAMMEPDPDADGDRWVDQDHQDGAADPLHLLVDGETPTNDVDMVVESVSTPSEGQLPAAGDLDAGSRIEFTEQTIDVLASDETGAMELNNHLADHEAAVVEDSEKDEGDKPPHVGDANDGIEVQDGQRRRGPPVNAWRGPPRMPPTSSRRPFRQRTDHNHGGVPAWKQFEGVALHLRPVATNAPVQHKRHAPPNARGPFAPLHVIPPGWQQQVQQQVHYPSGPALWGMQLVQQQQQPVFTPGTWAAQQIRVQHGVHAPVMYGAPLPLPLPCQMCPPPQPLVHMTAGVPQRPHSPIPGPAWTC